MLGRVTPLYNLYIVRSWTLDIFAVVSLWYVFIVGVDQSVLTLPRQPASEPSNCVGLLQRSPYGLDNYCIATRSQFRFRTAINIMPLRAAACVLRRRYMPVWNEPGNCIGQSIGLFVLVSGYMC